VTRPESLRSLERCCDGRPRARVLSFPPADRMTHKQAIVTMTIGEHHRVRWREHASGNWSRYAERHGYDVICIERPLDTSERARRRTPSWQKLLVLDQPFARRYERIVWVDADVLINPAAPSILDGVPIEKVGAADEYACPTGERFADVRAKQYRYWELIGSGFSRSQTPRECYEGYGLPARFDAVVQNGVMVLSPRHHRDLLLGVYHDYDYAGRGRFWNQEMLPLSYELLRADCVTWIDPRFNYPWSQYKALHYPFLLSRSDHPRSAEVARAALADVYFLHFCGETGDMHLALAEPPRTAFHPAQPAASPAQPGLHRRPAAGVETPVALLLCPQQSETLTERVLESIRRARPRHLLLVAEAAAGRDVVAELDWGCEVQTELVSSPDQGAAGSIASGLDWVFSLVEEAIVLQADCVPDPSFFRFCEELLAHHREDSRVMTISGDDFTTEVDPHFASYRYSRYPLTWGWATWRRAWLRHDPTMTRWPALRASGWLDELLVDRHAILYWDARFENAYRGRGGWNDAWTFACWRHAGLCVLPRVNLVANVGFGWDAPPSPESMFADMVTRPAVFPLAHSPDISPDVQNDEFLEDVVFSGNTARLLRRVRSQHARRRALAR
jgi:hypothetical protein